MAGSRYRVVDIEKQNKNPEKKLETNRQKFMQNGEKYEWSERKQEKELNIPYFSNRNKHNLKLNSGATPMI